MISVVITQQAERHLHEIFRYIETKDTALAAHRWTSKLLKTAMGIVKYPELGVIMPEEFGQNVHRIRLKKYYIYYTITTRQIQILAFIHSAREQVKAMQGKKT